MTINYFKSEMTINKGIFTLLLLIYFFILILAVVFAYKTGFQSGSRFGRSEAATNESMIIESNLKEKIANSEIGKADQVDVLRVSGQIVDKPSATSTNFLTISVNNLNRNPLSLTTPTVRKVAIDSKTRIVKMIRKSVEQILKERADYQKNKNFSQTTVPSNYFEVVVSLNDLKNGQTVRVASDHNIRNEAEFKATEIMLYE